MKDNAAKSRNVKKPNIFKRAWGKIKEVFSELKKVTWPTFPTVLKQLGAVLVTVVIVLVLILIIDLILKQGLMAIRGPLTALVEVL